MCIRDRKGPKEEQLDKEDTARFRKYLNKRWRGLHQFWKGQLTVKGGSDEYWNGIEHSLVRKGDDGWKKLFRICLTDPSLKRREVTAPDYNEAIYILDHLRPADERAPQPCGICQTSRRGEADGGLQILL